MIVQAPETSSARDFDFWMGSWTVRGRKLRKRLAGCEDWDELEATSRAWPLLEGLGNVDEFVTDSGGGYAGMSLRVFDPRTRTWSIYWADSRYPGPLEPPVVGSFDGDVGEFECDDVFNGKPIRVRYTWSRADPDAPRWEQAFSEDGGVTWETNWINDFTRVAGA
ncbi:MAG TPA: hypothetical protein VH538_00065 [Gaiellaceae bacterium]|jgi:hypothetical protein